MLRKVVQSILYWLLLLRRGFEEIKVKHASEKRLSILITDKKMTITYSYGFGRFSTAFCNPQNENLFETSIKHKIILAKKISSIDCMSF